MRAHACYNIFLHNPSRKKENMKKSSYTNLLCLSLEQCARSLQPTQRYIFKLHTSEHTLATTPPPKKELSSQLQLRIPACSLTTHLWDSLNLLFMGLFQLFFLLPFILLIINSNMKIHM